MLGLDAMAVLPILLLIAIIGAFISVATIIYVETASKGCEICGVEFLGESDLKAHMKEHSKVLDFVRPESFKSKESFKKAA